MNRVEKVFNISDITCVTPNCYDNSVLKTSLLNALSSTFKEGESFFMKSVTSFLEDRPEYRDRIIEFCKEERKHTQWHIELNRLTDSRYNNTSIQDLEKFTGKLLKPLHILPREYKLLITECLEHITYCLCLTALQADEFALIEGDTRDVFYHHSLEETGESHSSISRDIYLSVYGITLKRKGAMLVVYPALMSVVAAYVLYLWKTDANSKVSDFKDLFSILRPNSWLFKSSLRSILSW